ncbi:MAG: thiamine-phosphate kinase [Gammaproteobacteria bacterium]|nr:thiamine-phosphate kinase [Gammaproteobacteria bacterium]MDH5650876.1 thiamine-phosphate kinase [Gammaproteobacteria bacterium]
MPLSEFDIIQHCFASRTHQHRDVKRGIGDDAAVMAVPIDHDLVVAVDTLVEGVHFPVDTPARYIAWKALAVNLSDLAAMGAEPAWFTLALTMPKADEAWLNDFADGLFELADQYQMQLAGGDTTRGPLTVTIQIAGYVPTDKAMTRDGAKPGDVICVTNTLGDAAAGLSLLQHSARQTEASEYLIARLHQPIPRVATGRALRDTATACIDISDGLLADLGHILTASGVGARLQLDKLPLSAQLCRAVDNKQDQWRLALTGGDDYELCCCLPAEVLPHLTQIADRIGDRITPIGVIEAAAGIRLYDQETPCDLTGEQQGYRHFE